MMSWVNESIFMPALLFGLLATPDGLISVKAGEQILSEPLDHVELEEFMKYDDKFWWIAIQSSAYVDCMVEKGWPILSAVQASSAAVQAAAQSMGIEEPSGPYWTAVNKIGAYKAIIPFLDGNCKLPSNPSIQQRAAEAYLGHFRKSTDQAERHLARLTNEVQRLREDLALKQAIRSAQYCGPTIDEAANHEKLSLYSLGRTAESSLGYAAADSMLNEIVEANVFRRSRCRPALRPMPPNLF